MSTLHGPWHSLPVRVYYEDTDAAGIVYYANYLKFAERGRTEMMRHFGLDHRLAIASDGIAFAVRHCAADYRRPARLDELLSVRTRLAEVGGASLVMDQVVERDGEALVVMTLRLACITADARPARIPAPLRARLAAHLAQYPP